jgi:hypothetical protein
MGRLLRNWANEVASYARHYAPEIDDEPDYLPNPNSLTNSIIVSATQASLGQMHLEVGVSSTWKPTWELSGKVKGVTPRDTLILLHENWESIAGSEAYERAERKARKFGVPVTREKFLYRAAMDVSESQQFRMMASAIVSGIARGDIHKPPKEVNSFQSTISYLQDLDAPF